MSSMPKLAAPGRRVSVLAPRPRVPPVEEPRGEERDRAQDDHRPEDPPGPEDVADDEEADEDPDPDPEHGPGDREPEASAEPLVVGGDGTGHRAEPRAPAGGSPSPGRGDSRSPGLPPGSA